MSHTGALGVGALVEVPTFVPSGIVVVNTGTLHATLPPAGRPTFVEKSGPGPVTKRGSKFIDGSKPGVISNAAANITHAVPNSATSIHANVRATNGVLSVVHLVVPTSLTS